MMDFPAHLRGPAADLELDRLSVAADTTAARLRTHDRFCAVCSRLKNPVEGTCPRRRQLARELTARRALAQANRSRRRRR